MNEKVHVYRIYFSTNGKSYVGQTNNLERRMKAHLNSGSLVCKALYKYNNWQVSILHTCKSRDEANRIEIEEIRNFNSVAPNGYNLTAGGEGGDYWKGKHHTEETKEKISENNGAKRLEVRIRMSSSHRGKKFSDAHRAKMSFVKKGNQNGRGLKGYKHSHKSKLKMRVAQLKRRIREQGGSL